MYRSISTNRFSSDDNNQYSSYYNSSSSPSAKVPTALRALTSSQQQEMLPTYEPMSEAAKKDKIRTNFAEKAVHAIPLVLLICAFILWISSNSDIDVKGSSITENLQGMATKGDLASDDTGHLPLHLGDIQDTPVVRDNAIFTQNPS